LFKIIDYVLTTQKNTITTDFFFSVCVGIDEKNESENNKIVEHMLIACHFQSNVQLN